MELQRRRVVMSHSMPEGAIIEVEWQERSPIGMLNVLTATRRDIRRLTVGQKEGEKRDKDPNRS